MDDDLVFGKGWRRIQSRIVGFAGAADGAGVICIGREDLHSIADGVAAGIVLTADDKYVRTGVAGGPIPSHHAFDKLDGVAIDVISLCARLRPLRNTAIRDGNLSVRFDFNRVRNDVSTDGMAAVDNCVL